jgi:hypothetical protein
MKRLILGAATAIGIVAAGSAAAQEKLKIGVMATLSGPLTSGGEDGIRGVQIAAKQAGNKMGGREIELITVATDASPDSALRAARKLVEQDKVQIIIGPLSGSEGIALRDYSKTVPNVTIVNGSSGALEATYVNPSPNFFRFNSDGAMWMAGLGEYVFKDKGFKKVASSRGLLLPLHAAPRLRRRLLQGGGQIVQRQWVPLGTKDFGSVIANLPTTSTRSSSARRRRRRQLPEPVQPDGRQGEVHRRVDHGRPDGAVLSRRSQAAARRNAVLRWRR